MLERRLEPEVRNPLDTHAPQAGLVLRPWGFVGVVLALVAALALLAVPRFNQASAGQPGPVELRAGQPAQK